MSSLEARLSRDVEAWKPKPGDMLIGTVVDIESRPSEFSRDDRTVHYPVVSVLTDDDREVAFFGFHSAAKSEIAKLKPRVGDRFGVKYLGKVQGKKASYESYRCLVEHAEPETATEPDWDAIAGGAAEELADIGTPDLPDDDPEDLDDDGEPF